VTGKLWHIVALWDEVGEGAEDQKRSLAYVPWKQTTSKDLNTSNLSWRKHRKRAGKGDTEERSAVQDVVLSSLPLGFWGLVPWGDLWELHRAHTSVFCPLRVKSWSDSCLLLVKTTSWGTNSQEYSACHASSQKTWMESSRWLQGGSCPSIEVQ
jgi:hypothetical protein